MLFFDVIQFQAAVRVNTTAIHLGAVRQDQVGRRQMRDGAHIEESRIALAVQRNGVAAVGAIYCGIRENTGRAVQEDVGWGMHAATVECDGAAAGKRSVETTL